MNLIGSPVVVVDASQNRAPPIKVLQGRSHIGYVNNFYFWMRVIQEFKNISVLMGGHNAINTFSP